MDAVVAGPSCRPMGSEPSAMEYTPEVPQDPGWLPAQPRAEYSEPMISGPYARPDTAPLDAGGAFGEEKYVYRGPVREDLSSQITGSTNLFETGHAFIAGSLEVWLDGVYQGVAPRHYTEIGDHTFFLEVLPRIGEKLVVAYSRPTGALPAREDLTSQINSFTDVFTLPLPYVPGTVRLWVDGVDQGVPPKHFVEILPDQIRFLEYAPIVGEEVVVWYLAI